MPHNSDYSLIWCDTTNHLALMYEEIAIALGRPTITKVGQLCGDIDNNGNRVNAINKWAKFKPIRSFLETLTNEQRKIYTAFGFDRDAIYANTIYDIYTAAVQNLGDWPYLPPRGVNIAQNINEPFRPLDFTNPEGVDDGYKTENYIKNGNHIAVCPIEQSGPWSALFFRNRNYAEIQVKDVTSGVEYDYFKNDNDFNAAKIYLLFRKNGRVNIKAGYYVEDGVHIAATYADLVAGKNINFEDTPFYNTTQIAVLSNCPSVSSLDSVDPENDNSYEWLYLPDTFKIIPPDEMSISWIHRYTPAAQTGSGYPEVYIKANVFNNYIGSQSMVTVRFDRIRIQGEDSTEYDEYSDPAGDVITLSPGASGNIEVNIELQNPNYTPGETLDITVYYTITRVYDSHTEITQRTETMYATYL